MSTVPKTYIVSTGDISDFDGFLALPIYKKYAAKQNNCAVVFIMNYPAYIKPQNLYTYVRWEKLSTIKKNKKQELEKYKRAPPGKGYYYNSREFLSVQPLNDAAKAYATKYSITD
jgi:hypothetical protein